MYACGGAEASVYCTGEDLVVVCFMGTIYIMRLIDAFCIPGPGMGDIII